MIAALVDNHYKEGGFRLLLFFFTHICGIIANVNKIHIFLLWRRNPCALSAKC